MTKPFQLTDDMQQELTDGIKALAGTATDDPIGPSALPPSLRRRTIDRIPVPGYVPGLSNDTKVSDTEALRSEAPPLPEDPINPSHYRRHPSGVECIEITRHLNFNVGNAIKYIWRYADKGDPVENLKKAQWYLDDEIRRLQGQR